MGCYSLSGELGEGLKGEKYNIGLRFLVFGLRSLVFGVFVRVSACDFVDRLFTAQQ